MKRVVLMLALVLRATGLADDKTAANPAAPPLVLEPVMVYGETKLAFGFGLRVTRLEQPRVVLEMRVDRVQAGSEAERQGLKPGSRIMAINGREVASYEATFANDSELNRIFVDRSEGSRVTLQVVAPGKKKLQIITIVRRTVLYDRPKIGGLPN